MSEDKLNKYNNSKIYTIRCKEDNNLIYVGSTVQPLYKRWHQHKLKYNNENDKAYNYLVYIKMREIGFDSFYIELYENLKYDNIEKLLKREGEVIREIGTLNKKIEGRTYKEYYNENKEQILEKQKEYYNKPEVKGKKKEYYNKQEIKEKTKEYMKEYNKEYYEKNKEQYLEKQKQYRNKNKEKISQKRKELYKLKKLQKQQQEQQPTGPESPQEIKI
jgi:hypothetical protein